MKKQIVIILIALASCFTLFAENDFTLQGDVEMNIEQQIQQEISSEMDEVQMWMKLYEAAESQYIDMSQYPQEIEKYMIHQANTIDDYLTLVEDAEVLFYDGGDYKSKIEEAKDKLRTLKVLRQIFDEYIWYKNHERSENRLKISVDAIENNVAVPRMHRMAYTVMRGEYPVEVIKKESRISRLDKYVFRYRNGDVVTFQNNRLIEIEEAK